MLRLAATKALQDFGPAQANLSEDYQELMRNGGLCAVTFAEFLTAGLEYIAASKDLEERDCAYHKHKGTEGCRSPDMRYNKFVGPVFVKEGAADGAIGRTLERDDGLAYDHRSNMPLEKNPSWS